MRQRKRTDRGSMRSGRLRAVIFAASAVLTVTVSVGTAQAYFTTYATAKGGHRISLGTRTGITEEFSRWTKHISISNTGKRECFVRVKVFAGSTYQLDYTGNGAWRAGEDGYWYYDAVLPAGGVTASLDVKITLPEVTETDEEGNALPFTEDFNVVVIQECTAALYREDGTAYADWNMLLESTKDVYEEPAGAAQEVTNAPGESGAVQEIVNAPGESDAAAAGKGDAHE